VERMAGAEVHLVTKEEYTSVGSVALGERLAEQLRSEVHIAMRAVVPVVGPRRKRRVWVCPRVSIDT